MARWIAGHANAARGEPFLWLIGVSERRGVLEISHEELSTWWSQARAQFNGPPPRMTSVNVPVGDMTVVALRFEPEQPPYVVKNPAYNATDDPDRVKYEVPWREGTEIRTATHADLVLLLVPLSYVPDIEVLSGELSCTPIKNHPSAHVRWRLNFALYMVPKTQDRVTIPFHRCRVVVGVGNMISEIEMRDVTLRPDQPLWIPLLNAEGMSSPPRPLSRTVDSTPHETLLSGPGKGNLQAETETPPIAGLSESAARISISIGLAELHSAGTTIDVELDRAVVDGEKITWSAR